MKMSSTNREILHADLFGSFIPKVGFSFKGKEVTPAHPRALAFADAVCEMLQARMSLEVAQNTERDYTGHWSDKDYYQSELETYNRACDNLYSLAMENV
jgi:hypothetical protein